MSYTAYDTSQQDGEPVHLFEFAYDAATYRYTSLPSNYTAMSQVWLTSNIKMGEVRLTEQLAKNDLELQFPITDSFAQQLLSDMANNVITVTVFRGHINDPANEFITYWLGRISGSKVDKSTITIVCNSIFTSIRRSCVMRRYQPLCPHMLYKDGCNVDKELYDVSGTVDTVSGVTAQVSQAAGYQDGYFSAGMLEDTAGKLHFIIDHVGDTLTFQKPVVNLSVSDAIRLFPGCDRTRDTCNSRFSNILNHGGFPAMPSRNPFDGNGIL